jgi:hypothetical protein
MHWRVKRALNFGVSFSGLRVNESQAGTAAASCSKKSKLAASGNKMFEALRH